MTLRPLTFPVIALLVVGSACASKSSSSTPAPAGAPAQTRDPNVISERELSDPSVNSGDALSAVRKLRPGFLMSRGSGSIQTKSAGSIHASINGGALVSLSDLSNLRVTDVVEIRYLNASDATQRFGTTANTGPVILVKTR